MAPYHRDTVHFGKHRMYFEDPGICIVEYNGFVTVDEMRILCDTPEVEEHGDEFQLTICDMRKFGGIEPEARKLAARRPQRAAIYHCAYIGVSFATKVMVSMWARATNIIRGHREDVAFFEDMTSAKAWLMAKRAAHLEKPTGR